MAFWNLDGDQADIHDDADGHTGYWRNGPPAFGEGVVNRAARFDGGPAYGEINGVPAPRWEYTIDAWVRPTSTRDMAIVEHGGGGALAITGRHFTFRNVNDDISASWRVELDRWYHVAGVWDAAGGESRLYVDGNLAAEGTSNARPSGTSTLYIGRGAIAGNFQGQIDAVGYYDHVLHPWRLKLRSSWGHSSWDDRHPAPAASAPVADPAPAATVTAPAPAEPAAAPAPSSTAPAPVTAASKLAATSKARAKKAKAKAKARRAKARRARARRARRASARRAAARGIHARSAPAARR